MFPVQLREKSIAIQQGYKNIKGGRVEDQKVSDFKGFVKDPECSLNVP
jgi:hypothetical protein